MIRMMLLPALTIAAPAAAQTAFQDTAALDGLVKGFTGRAIGEDGGARTAIDTRLKLAQCPTVGMSWHGINHDAVVVACAAPAWRIFVPVKTVAAPAAAAPTTIARAVPAAPPVKVIKRGDPVTIAAESTGFSISREGVAMSDAVPGGRFLVKVDGTRRAVQAVAVEAGHATLPGWDE